MADSTSYRKSTGNSGRKAPNPLALSSALRPPPSALSSALRPQPSALSSALRPQPSALSSALRPPPSALSSALRPQPSALSSALRPPPSALSSALRPQPSALSSALRPPPSALSSALRPPPYALSPGFTLLELLVVLAIAALLLAVTPPLITSALPGVELKASARRVAAGLRLAREEAIRSGSDIAFTLDVEERSFQVDGGFRNGTLPDGLKLKLEAAGTEMLSDHKGSVRFFPDGSSTGGRVILARDDRGFQVGVQWLTGRIRIAPWEGD